MEARGKRDTMKKLIIVMIAVLMGSLTVAASGPQHGRGNNKHSKDKHSTSVRDKGAKPGVHVVFSTDDARMIREYYAPRYRTLPPGLQKKLARNGTLPPGWQKKMQPFPVALERTLVVLPPDYRRGIIDRRAVIYNPRTLVIIDLTDLF
jgi:hypothetical protein